MKRFQQLTSNEIPDEAKPVLDRVKADYGFVPNVVEAMAPSPQLLRGYVSLAKAFEKSSLSPEEQQIVLLTASRINECAYCTSVHSITAENAELDWSTIENIRNREPLSNGRHEALRKFTERVVVDTGSIPHDAWTELINAGFQPQAALDVVLGVALKTLTNSLNHLVETPLDEQLRGREWSAEKAQMASA